MELSASFSLPGTVYWVTGLSGAGKSTIGWKFFNRLRAAGVVAVFLDGDILREVFGDDLGHGLEDRRKSAMRNARLCHVLAQQGISVVCCTISMFHSVQQWSRDHIPRYREIYLRVPMDVLRSRDQKGLYSRAERGEAKNVMGIDLPVEEPLNPDMVLDNDGSLAPDEMVERLFRQVIEGSSQRSRENPSSSEPSGSPSSSKNTSIRNKESC